MWSRPNGSIDVLLQPLRKTLKLYHKVVLQHLDMALVNSYIYIKIGCTKRQVQFRKSVISSLLASDVQTDEDLPKTFHHHKISDLTHLSGQHYLALITATASKKMLRESALSVI